MESGQLFWSKLALSLKLKKISRVIRQMILLSYEFWIMSKLILFSTRHFSNGPQTTEKRKFWCFVTHPGPTKYSTPFASYSYVITSSQGNTESNLTEVTIYLGWWWVWCRNVTLTWGVDQPYSKLLQEEVAAHMKRTQLKLLTQGYYFYLFHLVLSCQMIQ